MELGGYFIVLKIPALHLPIFTSTEEVRMPWADLKGTHSANMTCKRKFQFSGC